MSRWMLYTKRADFNRLSARFHISPMLARILVNRGVSEGEMEEFLGGDRSSLHSPFLLKDMEKAVALLKQEIMAGRKIRVVGDYDIDGICSTFFLVDTLSFLGACVDYEIPHRIKDGYGINPAIVAAAAEEGARTVLTCDNGIAAFSAAELARERELIYIVTDHHDVHRDEEGRDRLPAADAIINPKREDCPYPFKNLCSGVMAFKLCEALLETFGRDKQRLFEMLDIAAIATVGDVMPLRGENRIIVKEGLKGLADTHNIGLRALIGAAELEGKTIGTYHVGFILGPCLNAGGRLESAKIGLRLLLAAEPEEAQELAGELRRLNEVRKEMTRRGFEEACRLVEARHLQDPVLLVYLKDCHESLAGIIVGRLKEKYYRPAIVLTDAEEGLLKGSGRSIAAYSMFEKLSEAKELLIKFGGHPMAAGLSLYPKNLEAFRKRLLVKAGLKEEDGILTHWIDIPLPFSHVTRDFIRELSLLEPFGQGNERPLFAQKEVSLLGLRILGKDKNVLRLRLRGSDGALMEGIIFGEGADFSGAIPGEAKLDVLYYPEINTYLDRENIQIIIKDWKFHEK